MLEAMHRAAEYGYYMPDIEIVYDPPPVCTAFWSAEEWIKWGRPAALETH